MVIIIVTWLSFFIIVFSDTEPQNIEILLSLIAVTSMLSYLIDHWARQKKTGKDIEQYKATIEELQHKNQKNEEMIESLKVFIKQPEDT